MYIPQIKKNDDGVRRTEIMDMGKILNTNAYFITTKYVFVFRMRQTGMPSAGV